jgi:dihydrofolate reductase
MRQLRYSVAASLDGFIAGPNGEYDWIPMDPEVDFAAMYARFSALIMGRRSYEVSIAQPGAPPMPMPAYVCSRTLPPGERDGVTFVRDAAAAVRELKQADGKPLWLWGGGDLFRSLLDADLVDGVDVAIIPVLLAAGIPLLPAGRRASLRLRTQRLYATTGMMSVEYDVKRP